MRGRYQKAIEYLPWTITNHVYGMKLIPHWKKSGNRFWYEHKTSGGQIFYRVNPSSGQKEKLATKPQSPPAQNYPDDLVISPNGKWAIQVRGGKFIRPVLARRQKPSTDFRQRPGLFLRA